MYILVQLYKVRYTPLSLYMRAFVLDFLLFLIILALFFFFREYRSCGTKYGKALLVHILAFVHGFFALTGVFSGYLYHPSYSGYRLFAFPLLISALVWLLTLGLYLFVSTSSWFRFFYLLIPLAVAAVMAVVSVLFTLSHVLLASLICASLCVPGVLFFFFMRRV